MSDAEGKSEVESPEHKSPAKGFLQYRLWLLLPLPAVLICIVLLAWYYSPEKVKNRLEGNCCIKLRSLASCQLRYAGSNQGRFYGSSDELIEAGILGAEFDPETYIDGYQIFWHVNLYTLEPDMLSVGTGGEPSRFTIFAMPSSDYPGNLGTFAVDSGLVIRKTYERDLGNEIKNGTIGISSWEISNTQGP